MTWGLGVVFLLGVVAWLFREPGSSHLGRAFGVLLLYALLFWLSLLKIWWTAGQPAVVLEPKALAYRSVVGIGPRRIPYDQIVVCSPRPGTQSQRLVYVQASGRAREFFLNLGVVKGRNELFKALGAELTARGLVAIEGERNSWQRPDWREA